MSGPQVPSPWQLAARVATLLLQDPVRQDFLVPGYAHWSVSVPSQLPAHADPSLAHARRAPCGEPVTAMHTPSLPTTSHAWHWPVQASSQQTASMQ
jgi:hypothetical protein